MSGVFKPKSDKGSAITLVIIIPSLLRLEQMHPPPAPAFFLLQFLYTKRKSQGWIC